MADLSDPNTWLAFTSLAISLFVAYTARATYKRQFPGRFERLESKIQSLEDKYQADTNEASLIAVELKGIKAQMSSTISSIDRLTDRIDNLYSRKS